MKAPSLIGRILIVLAATLMLVLSAGLAWAAVTDYQARGLVPTGVTVVGTNLSGMTETQARAAIKDAVSTPLLRPVTITGDKKVWTLDPEGIVAIDIDTMLAEAYSPRRTATFVTRFTHQVTGEPLPADIKPAYSVDASAISTWVGQTAKQIDRKPKDATRTFVEKKYKIKVTKCAYGATLNRAAAAQQISAALTADAALANANRTVALPITVGKPKVVESMFKTAIVVSLDKTRIYLYKGDKLIKSYPCAPGRPAYPTPTGDFRVDTKLKNASWHNPHSAWSASMPEVIGPGPYNPMGVRKIGINYSGVFMHGIPPGEFSSIGTHASHGCMRMFPRDVADLFDRVEVGDPVYIRE
jgi:lipoprotein-anchoring transpeptidase ErfK/SrfK